MRNTNQHPIFSVVDNIIKLITLNLLFILGNLPLTIYIFLTGANSLISSPALTLLFSLSVGPSLIALFRCSFDYLNHRFSYKRFFTSYIASYSKDSLPLFLIQITLLFLSFTNFLYSILPIFSILAPIYFILKFSLFMLFPFVALEIALFHNSTSNILKNAFILFSTHPRMLLVTLGYFLFTLLIVNELPVSLLFFTFSLYAYLFTSFSFNTTNKRIALTKEDSH